MKFDYYWRDKITTEVDATDLDNIKIVNHTDDFVQRAFGVKEKPTADDLYYFLKSRVFPRSRVNCEQLLEDLGLTNYSPYDISRKTYGTILEDFNWIKYPDQDVTWEDIKKRLRIR